MNYKWHQNNLEDNLTVEELAKSINVSIKIAQILVQRGITNFDEAKSFFRPQLDQLHDPFRMKDMTKAVSRICDAINQEEKIIIYGDYDVDGTTAVALVFHILKKYCQKLVFYIPDRFEEGYGISTKGIDWAVQESCTLMIALDCGIRAIEKVDYANTLGLDVIICDHHIPDDTLPDAVAILNPKQIDCPYPFKELSGCGVAFKLLQAFASQMMENEADLFEYLDLVAVSIGSDIVPIVGENRILAYYGLKKLNENPLPGFKFLMNARTKEMSITDVVFFIGPRINAAGRLYHAKKAVELLISHNEADLIHTASLLQTQNKERQKLDSQFSEEAFSIIENTYKNQDSIVLFNDNWHKGVLGIIASRCVEKYYKPIIILTESKGMATGSARSVLGFNIYESLCQCDDILTQFGGHAFAAGMTLPLEKVNTLRKKFEKIVNRTLKPHQKTPILTIDVQINFDFINFKNYNIIKQMEPFGPQNMDPLFETHEVFFKEKPQILKKKHFKATLFQESNEVGIKGIGFGLARFAEKIKPLQKFKIVYHIQKNTFFNSESLELNLKDIKI